jgi:hypothetical protein
MLRDKKLQCYDEIVKELHEMYAKLVWAFDLDEIPNNPVLEHHAALFKAVLNAHEQEAASCASGPKEPTDGNKKGA